MRAEPFRLAIAIGLPTLLCPGAAFAASVPVSVDLTADRHAINPEIYGVSFGDATRDAQIGYPVRRWGGNSTTRYNWQVDVHNTANDWYFENIAGAADRTHVPPLGNSADAFVRAALAADSRPLITIPTIGWTPRTDSPLAQPYFAGFSVAHYGVQQSTDPWDPDAGNGIRADGATPVTGNDPRDTSFAIGPPFEQGWIAHLQSTFGSAATGGVPYYALDNESMLWNSTQRDVHPVPPTYAEIWQKAVDYAAAIKAQDPAAQVFGPVTWGYCDLFGSAADNCVDGPDRKAHAGTPFVLWYLQQVCAYQQARGVRLVDYLDLHYYPQGTNVALSDDDSATTAALRLHSLKELYDPTWVSESWIADLGDTDANHYDKPDLIPRVEAWIAQACPGTKLAITEYNWGNDGTTSGALAQAELLAIFGREGVDLATRWIAPDSGSLVERAFRLYLDYDGAGSRVEGISVRAISADVDTLGAYAVELPGRRVMILLFNKATAPTTAALDLGASFAGNWTLYQFTGGSDLGVAANGTIAGTMLTLANLPAGSASLLVLPDVDRIFANGFEAP